MPEFNRAEDGASTPRGFRALSEEPRGEGKGTNGAKPGGPNGGDPKKRPQPAPPPGRGMFGVVAILLVGLLMFFVLTSSRPGENITLAEFETQWRSGMIKPGSVVITDEAVTATKVADPSSPVEVRVVIPLNTATSKAVAEEVKSITGGDFKSQQRSKFMDFLFIFGPFVLLILLVWFLISRGLRSAGAGGGMLGSFGKSRHRTFNKEVSTVTFSDVAGIDEAKDEVAEIIEFLKNPKKFQRLGGRIPRGVLLVGEPGCGKTLLAKAIAGEADVPFFSISGSDFVEMFVGVGASRVRDLFKTAKESAPCIIFLDEIDAVGRRRGGGFTTGGHDEREQTLNAILVEMDGFATGDGVIVIAATNRSDVLDPALVRPGRFDRQIVVTLPDVKGRLEILRVHARKVKLAHDVDMEKLARATPMFSGADLAAIINEGAILATLQGKDAIEQIDLEEARDKVRFGRARKSRKRDKEENRATAYHEAGHAVIQSLLKDADPLHKVTIIPRGQALGATFSLPEKDRTGYGARWLRATMRVLCGGRIAEERATGDVSSGAAMDIAQVTELARKMVLEWGMSEKLGFIRYAGMDNREMYMPEKDYSDETARLVDEEVRRLVDEAYVDARRILDENWSKVEAVAEALLAYETLTDEDVNRLIGGGRLSKPSVAEMLREEPARPAPKAPEPEADLPPGAMPSPA